MNSFEATALSVGKAVIQIVSKSTRPRVEIYHQVHNEEGIYISFLAVNIGTERAEDVRFVTGGDFRREPPFSFGALFTTSFPSMAPTQSVYLLRLEQHELFDYSKGEGLPSGMKREMLKIAVSYHAPKSVFNVIPRMFFRLLNRPRFRYTYAFNPLSVQTELPPRTGISHA